MKNKLIVFLGSVLGFAPLVALAQQATTGGTPQVCPADLSVVDIQTFLCRIADILNAVLPVLIALGVVYFVWGVIQYVISSDEEAKKSGRDRIIYGIIGLAVIIGVWGLVRILTNTFGIDNQENITFPTVPY